MFNSLTGFITAKLPQTVYLDVSGVEWDISIPDSSLEKLPNVGEQSKIYTWLLHREDLMKIYGFATPSERALFLDLLKVDGVGPKGALKILSGIPSQVLIDTLDDGDVGKLEKLPGVGKKTAQKMMLALKGKLTLLDEQTGIVKARTVENVSPWNDVINALCDMGYERRVVEQTIQRLVDKSVADGADSSSGASHADKEEKLFRAAIVELAK